MQVVVLAERGEREVDLAVLRPDAIVADLATALGISPTVYINGQPFAPAEALADVGLSCGSLIASTPQPSAQTAGVSVYVVGGLDAGRSLPLTPGRNMIGRSPQCRIVLGTPGVSREHCTLILNGTSAQVIDLASKVGTWLGGESVTDTRQINAEQLLEVGDNHLLIAVEPAGDDRPLGLDLTRDVTPAGVIAFNRPPRRHRIADESTVRPPEAPTQAANAPFNIAAILSPIAAAGVTAGVTGHAAYALMGLASPVMLVANLYETRHRGKRSMRRGVRQFEERLDALRQQLASRADADADILRDRAPHLVEVLRRAADPSERLWERRPGHDDFMAVSLGYSDISWVPPVETGYRELAPEVAEIIAGSATMCGVPVTADLRPGDAFGLVGDRRAVLAVVRALVCQSAVHQGPADLSIALLARPDTARDWDWIKWLPHTRDARGRGDQRLLATGGRPRNELAPDVAQVINAVSLRFSIPADKAGAQEISLLIIDDLDLFAGRGAPARALLKDGRRVTSIVIAPTRDQLPAACSVVLDVHGEGGAATLYRSRIGDEVENFLSAGISEHTARTCARSLARFEDPDLIVPGGSIPDECALLPLLGLTEAQPEDIARRWSAHPPGSNLSTPIGLTTDGVMNIDVVDNGPHALIGGTTGSGKSELLRSLIAGMASLAPPESLAFVLIDFKGGETFHDFGDLPHLAGMATDLDEHLAERALRCLDAELSRREQQRNALGIRDIRDQTERAAPADLRPMPRLVVVIDEFGEMAGRLPGLLDSLDSIARRGRTLGMHLILATQKPAGVVSSYVASNVDMKIALRVQGPEDSSEVIGIPDAAFILRSQPGRAMIRFAANRVSPVQTAFGGAPLRPPDMTAVETAHFVLGRTSRIPGPGSARIGPGETDIERLLSLISAASHGHRRPESVWLDPLPAVLPLAELPPVAPPHLAIGLIDDPEHQRQFPLAWNLDGGNLLIYGGVGTGKTHTLLTIAAALASAATPDRAHMFALDFGSGLLAQLERFPHTGAVIPAADIERQERLVTYLGAELSRRRALPSAERQNEPRIVLLIDNYGALAAAHGELFGQGLPDDLVRIYSDGPGVGIHTAVTADRVGAIPNAYASVTQQKVVLQLADPLDYTSVGLSARTRPTFTPGRGLLAPAGLELQVAAPSELEETGASAHDRPPETNAARRITALPTRLFHSALLAASGPAHCQSRPWLMPIGLTDATLEAATLPLYDGEHIVIAGPPRSGRSSVLTILALQLLGASGPAVRAIALRPSPLRDVPGIQVATTSKQALATLHETAATSPNTPVVLFIDDAELLGELDEELKQLIARRAPEHHLCIAARSDVLRVSYGHWTQEARKSRLGVLLRPDLDLDGALLSVQLPRKRRAADRPGLGYLAVNGEVTLAQFAAPDVDH